MKFDAWAPHEDRWQRPSCECLQKGHTLKWQDWEERSGAVERICRTQPGCWTIGDCTYSALQSRPAWQSINSDTTSSTALPPLTDAHLTGDWKGMESWGIHALCHFNGPWALRWQCGCCEQQGVKLVWSKISSVLSRGLLSGYCIYISHSSQNSAISALCSLRLLLNSPVMATVDMNFVQIYRPPLNPSFR
jgi:hypothetical protein